MMGYFVTNISLNLLVKEFFKIGVHFSKLQAKWLIVTYRMTQLYTLLPQTFVLKDAELAR